MHRLRRPVSLAALYVGSIVGAGFATGQEIWQFFAVFGIYGRWGVMLASGLLAVLGTLAFHICRRRATSNYAVFLKAICGWQLAILLDAVMTVFLALSTGLMLAASNALFQEHLGGMGWLGTLATALILGIAVLGQQRSLMAAAAVLVPFLLAVTVTVAVVALLSPGGNPVDLPAAGSWVGGSWVWAAVLYASYNLLLGMVVLAGLGSGLRPGEEWAGLVGGIMVGLLALSIEEALRHHAAYVAPTAIPMLYLAAEISPLWEWLYALALWAAILTTAAGTVYALATRWGARSRLTYRLTCLAVIGGAVLVSRYQFVFLVGRLYPVAGYLGFFLVVALPVEVFLKRRK